MPSESAVSRAESSMEPYIDYRINVDTCCIAAQVSPAFPLEVPMSASVETVELTRGNRRAELPLIAPALGPAMIDTRRLREETGYWAFDPAFGETGACRSAITYVDGDEGVLLYRGYPIDQLVERCRYL